MTKKELEESCLAPGRRVAEEVFFTTYPRCPERPFPGHDIARAMVKEYG